MRPASLTCEIFLESLFSLFPEQPLTSWNRRYSVIFSESSLTCLCPPSNKRKGRTFCTPLKILPTMELVPKCIVLCPLCFTFNLSVLSFVLYAVDCLTFPMLYIFCVCSKAWHHVAHLPHVQEEMDVVLVSVLADKQHKMFYVFWLCWFPGDINFLEGLLEKLVP